MKQLMHFIGSRPLVGYFLEFDVAMLNRVVFPMLGFGLPQAKIEVSALYHAHKMRQLPAHQRCRAAGWQALPSKQCAC